MGSSVYSALLISGLLDLILPLTLSGIMVLKVIVHLCLVLACPIRTNLVSMEVTEPQDGELDDVVDTTTHFYESEDTTDDGDYGDYHYRGGSDYSERKKRSPCQNSKILNGICGEDYV